MHEILKFSFRLVRHLLVFLFLCLPLMIVGMIVLLPACYLSKGPQLPIFLRWLDCADFYVGRDTSVIEQKVKEGPLVWYNWIALRNPINYFQYKYLSFQWPKNFKYLRYIPEDNNIGDSTGDEPGLKYIEIETDGKVFYEYYYIKKWSLSTCLRFRLGWKIGDPTRNRIGDLQQFVLVLSPYKSYSGR
jgi:hypothetical protein